jgi:hypothetical protein
MSKLTKVGEIVVDNETGEVIEWPEDLTTWQQKASHLMSRYHQAQEEEKAWTNYRRFLGSILATMLNDQQLESYTDDDLGLRTAVKRRTTEKAEPPKVAEILLKNELVAYKDIPDIIVATAKTLDPETLRNELSYNWNIDSEIIESMIDKTVSSAYAEVRVLRQPAPKIITT